MITIEVEFGSGKKIISFKVYGHSLDYVCSAVSTLTINTVNSIEKFTDDTFFCDYDKKGGFLEFKLNNVDSVCDETNLLLNSMMMGLGDMEAEYPKYLRIVNKGV